MTEADKREHLRTPFGVHAGRVVSPSDVESGLACACVCPGCGAILVAKKGKTVAWHFAHHAVQASVKCVESAIHAAAKQILTEAKYVEVPEKWVAKSGRKKNGSIHTVSRQLGPAKTIRFDYCVEEVWEKTVRPDVVGYRDGRRLLVEMFFTHRVDEVKRNKLAALRTPALEINLSDLAVDAGFEQVRQRVLSDTIAKEWLFYPGEAEALADLAGILSEEIKRLDAIDATKMQAEKGARETAAAIQRKKTERLERERTIVANARLAAAALEDGESNAYRMLPIEEKERRLRAQLDIRGLWPNYLNLATKQASPVAEPLRIWQGSLFLAFIFGKAASTSRLYPSEALRWVSRWFSIPENRMSQANTAIRQFLAYLAGCGFLEKAPYQAGEENHYIVIHGLLTPPVGRPPKIGAIPVEALQHGEATVKPIIKPHWLWRASWPDAAERTRLLSQALESSGYKAILAPVLETLSPSNRPNEPLVSALLLEAQGVPREVTLELLTTLKLALKSTRRI